MIYPRVPNSDPAADVRDLLVRFFRPGMVDSVIRTWVPVALGSLLSWLSLNFQWLGLPNSPSATLSLTVSGLIIAGYYLLARVVERRWPRIGRVLLALNLTAARPTYAAPAAAARVEAAAEQSPPPAGR